MEVHVDPADNNHRIVDDPFGAYTDLLSFNQYIGWYDGLPDKLAKIRWTFALRQAGDDQRIRRRCPAGQARRSR